MLKVILLFLSVSFALYSYNLGAGVTFGTGAGEIKSFETQKTGDKKDDFTYDYKYGLLFVNKVRVSETIYFDTEFSFDFLNLTLNGILKRAFLVKNVFSFEFYPLKQIFDEFYFKTGLFFNYYFTDGYCEKNLGVSMLAATLAMGYNLKLGKLKLVLELNSELPDIINFRTKTRAYIGLGGSIYFLYKF